MDQFPNMSDLFEPLKNAIIDQLIPALGSDRMRDKWCGKTNTSSSCRHGRLGLTNPQETAKTQYENSILITAKLTDEIHNQKLGLEYTPQTSYIPGTWKAEYDQRNTKCWNSHNELLEELTPESKKLIKGAMQKGASSWLSALLVKAIGYILNKQEFIDAICMMYEW